MENFPLKFSPVGQLYPESMSDSKSRFFQNASPSGSRAEVICPRPCRVTTIPGVLDSLSRFGPQAKGTFPMRRANSGLGILDAILPQDELGDSDTGSQLGFLCGSPPVRTNNPVVHDAEFAKLTQMPSSPLGNSLGTKQPRHDKGSPSCSSPLGQSPKVRIEGFACGSPGAVQALA